MQYTLEQKHLDQIESVLEKDIIGIGVHCVCMIDLAGNVLASLDNGRVSFDVYTLAALSAGNFGAINAIAKVIGEEEFSLLFHKGKRESIYFSRILTDFLLVTIFGKETTLGFLRLKVGEVTTKIKKILMS